jgi:hypothetical protein
MSDTTIRNFPRSIYHLTDDDCPAEVVSGDGSHLGFHPTADDDAFQADPCRRFARLVVDEQPANLVGTDDDDYDHEPLELLSNLTADQLVFLNAGTHAREYPIDLTTLSSFTLQILIADAWSELGRRNKRRYPN